MVGFGAWVSLFFLFLPMTGAGWPFNKVGLGDLQGLVLYIVSLVLDLALPLLGLSGLLAPLFRSALSLVAVRLACSCCWPFRMIVSFVMEWSMDEKKEETEKS